VVSGLLLNRQLQLLPAQEALLVGVAGAALLAALPFVTIRYLPLDRIGDLLRRIPLERLDEVGRQIEGLERSPELARAYPRFFVLTLLEQLIPILGLLLLARALQIPLSLLTIASFLPVSMLVSRIPISVEALGVREGLYVFFLSLFGVGGGTAFALAIATRIMDVLVVGSGALVSSVFISGTGARESGYRGA
jgi:uncharacterized membrane protein YbhN (UPF0104 family)